MQEPHLQKSFDEQLSSWTKKFKKAYLQNLRSGAMVTLVWMPLVYWALKGFDGTNAAYVSAVMLAGLPFVALPPAFMLVGPRPTRAAYQENLELVALRHEAELKAKRGLEWDE